MKIVVTLGGNALLRRGEALSFENQRRNIEKACAALANLARNHELILSHGNGPQVGLIARQNEAYAAADPSVPPYPFDVLGAESQAMIGYMFTQALTGLPVQVILWLTLTVQVLRFLKLYQNLI